MKYLLLTTTLLFFSCAVFLQNKNQQPPVAKKYLKPPAQIKHFTLGYSDAFASLIWLRLLQDIEYCENGQYTEADYVAPLVDAKNRVRGVLDRKMKPSKCNKGWVYSMLDVLTEIEPRFKIAYDIGAVTLSVIVDDREGARLMFEKGLVQYPKDWALNYAAGYHYLWEVQNVERAAELLKTSVENGGPSMLASLSAALYSEFGQYQVAEKMLRDTLKKSIKPELRERIEARLKALESLRSSLSP